MCLGADLPDCRVGIEACATSHYWARQLSRLGHDVKLIAPIYVKPYVKRGKSDAADAEAIYEAITRPTMRFVEVKSPDQQAILSLHRAERLTCLSVIGENKIYFLPTHSCNLCFHVKI